MLEKKISNRHFGFCRNNDGICTYIDAAYEENTIQAVTKTSTIRCVQTRKSTDRATITEKAQLDALGRKEARLAALGRKKEKPLVEMIFVNNC